jgi:pyruvate kinase
MILPGHKTKIVCTIGPASQSPEIMVRMIRAGMAVARLNFSHGEFAWHRNIIGNLRAAAKAAGRRLAIMADLPGPKIRLGRIEPEPVQLQSGQTFTLTTREVVGTAAGAAINFARLPEVVKAEDVILLNDGLIQLAVQEVVGSEVICQVLAGGELSSRKGVNLPGLDLGLSAFTENDHACLKFALEAGVDAVSQSFVESGEDLEAVRQAAAALGHQTFIIAKIERSRSLDHLDSILDSADGLMVARGDLGVELPLERIAVVQKMLIREAILRGLPVITATQMLESMLSHPQPTRAEATDVANAILDGTDCVMLSGESSVGLYPVEAVAMLAKIAHTVEPLGPAALIQEALRGNNREERLNIKDLIARSVATTLSRIRPAAVFVPTRGGDTARRIARFRPPEWIVAVSSLESTCQRLQFSAGVFPVHETEHPEDWKSYISQWLHTHHMQGSLAVVTEGPSSKHPETNHRMEIISLDN